MMGAFLYGTALQWRLDIRSRTLLITCYVVPLLFFCNDGRDFYIGQPVRAGNAGSVHDGDGCLHGGADRPAALAGGDLRQRYQKKLYKANGVPLYFGLIPASLVHIFCI